jgi:hypothetical protein
MTTATDIRYSTYRKWVVNTATRGCSPATTADADADADNTHPHAVANGHVTNA